MIISHKHKFIFLATGKTGTVSITAVLQKFDQAGAKFHRHCRFTAPSILIDPRGIEKELKFDPSDYFKFCFVRNPWDRMVSMYRQMQRSNNLHWKPRRIRHNLSKRYSFKGFIKRVDEEAFKTWCQSNFYLIGDNLIDFVGRFENLQEDFNAVCDKIGIARQKLPHKNKSNHKHYTHYYDEEARDIVAKKYARDIEIFNYKFGD
tara:strand:+ start:1468 stop:2079 length:612 start_codon:yes stop_codon:yes gene_type:complete